MTNTELGLALQERLNALNSKLGVKRHLEKELAETLRTREAAEAEELLTSRANTILQTVIENQREELRLKIENLISYGLTVVFGEQFKLHLELTTARNQTSAEFYVSSSATGGHPVRLIDARGGGLVLLTAFLLRVIMLLSSRPPLRRVMFLDEPFKMVSDDYVPNLIVFLRELAEKTEVQFIIVTHDLDIAEMGDKHYRMKLADGHTQVELR